MRLRLSLIAKITLATSLILICFMTLLDYLNSKNFRRTTVQYAIDHADQLTEIINQSTYDAMMHNDKASLYSMIGRISMSDSIERVRLIDPFGKIVYSNHVEEKGTVIDKGNVVCTFCHETGSLHTTATMADRSRVYRNAEGEEMLGFSRAIYNQPACYTAACHFHSKDNRILGVLDMDLSLERLNKTSREYRMQFVLLIFMLLLLIGIIITAMMRRLVDKPVQRLVQHTREVASGNFDTKLPVTTSDELGDLSVAVNLMTENLARAQEELKEWGTSLEKKVEERSNEIKMMQLQLYRSEKLASLGNLVAGIAHEINNPLSGVLMYSSLVANDKKLDPELKPDLERVISECQRCATIVKQLLEFSREAKPHKSTISINTLIDKVGSLLRPQPAFKNIKAEKHYDNNLDDVFIDINQIQQVLINLFINASHAMPDGGIIVITTSKTDDGNFASVQIKDSGCGIAKEMLERIFDPFFTTKSEGTGLGLSISYGFVENNGGTIEVESELGEGTLFTIKLPLVSKKDQEPA